MSDNIAILEGCEALSDNIALLEGCEALSDNCALTSLPAELVIETSFC